MISTDSAVAMTYWFQLASQIFLELTKHQKSVKVGMMHTNTKTKHGNPINNGRYIKQWIIDNLERTLAEAIV